MNDPMRYPFLSITVRNFWVPSFPDAKHVRLTSPDIGTGEEGMRKYATTIVIGTVQNIVWCGQYMLYNKTADYKQTNTI